MVVSGSGPSSKVIATTSLPVFPRLITGKKNPQLGKNAAKKQTIAKIASGIIENHTSKNISKIEKLMKQSPNTTTGDNKEFFMLCLIQPYFPRALTS
jgi:hypothetical protein